MTCGYPSIATQTMPEAEAKLRQLGYEAFALIVIDTGLLGEASADLQSRARHLLQSWSGQYPGLPVVFLGTALQKYAVFAAHLSHVPFVTRPFGPHDLMQTVQPLLPEDCRLPPRSSMPTSTKDRMPGDSLTRKPPPEALSPGDW